MGKLCSDLACSPEVQEAVQKKVKSMSKKRVKQFMTTTFPSLRDGKLEENKAAMLVVVNKLLK